MRWASAFLFATLFSSAVAQQDTLRDQLVGAWSRVELNKNNILPDGTKKPVFEGARKGIVIFDAGGGFAMMKSTLIVLSGNQRAGSR